MLVSTSEIVINTKLGSKWYIPELSGLAGNGCVACGIGAGVK